MKKLVALMLPVIMLASCSDMPDGAWDPFKWDKKEYKNVSAEGATLVSTLKNYGTCWLEGTTMDSVCYHGGSIHHIEEDDSTYYDHPDGTRHYMCKNPRLDVKIEGKKVTMVVAPNPDPVPHTFYVELSYMDCFGPGIKIEQKAGK